MVRVENVLDNWAAVRADTAAAVEEFPAGDLGFRAVPELMTFGEIAFHILEASHGLTGLLLDGEEVFTGPEFREKIKAHYTGTAPEAPPHAVAAALRNAVAQRVTELKSQSADWWAGIVTRVDGQRVTRLEMMMFVKEHELTHRAQMFLYMRLKGLVPPTTRRRLAAAKK